MSNEELLFQSTHPHGVRLQRIIDTPRYRVSIHAPTRGATGIQINANPSDMFQSTHPHGVRLFELIEPIYQQCFNPRTHTGCDRSTIPPRCAIRGFQSTHPHGVRLIWDNDAYIVDMFQSTHPHGVRQCAKLHIISQ